MQRISIQKKNYHISSNGSRVSYTRQVSTSRGSDCICSNTSQVSNTCRASNRSRDITSNTIELMVLVHRTVVCCVFPEVLRCIGAYWYVIIAPKSSKKRKSYTLKLKFEAGKLGGSSRSQVSNTSQVSNRSWGSDSIVLIQAGDFY